MFNFEILGYVGGAIIAISLIPQIWKSWKTKSTKDISIAWTLIYVVGLLIYITYGIGIQQLPIIIMGAIEISLAASLLVAKMIYS